MSKQSTDDQAPSPTAAFGRGLKALEADLEVIGSPWTLWLRLLIAAILGSVLTGIGLLVAFDFVDYALAGTLNDFGSPIGPIIGGATCLVLGLIVFAAGWGSFRAYRRRGLI